MNAIDIIYIISIVVTSLVGFFTGFLSKVSTIVGVVFGLFNAMVFHEAASKMLQEATGWEELTATITAFAALLVITIVIVKLVAALLAWILDVLHLGILNRLAGAAFSALMSLVIVTAIVDVSSIAAPENRYTGKAVQQESQFYNNITKKLYKDIVTRLF